MKRLFVGFLLGATFTSALAPASSSAAPLEATTLSHVSPSGLMPGETVQLQAIGGALNDATTLWTNIPGAVCTLEVPKPPAATKDKDGKPVEPPKPDPSRARFQVKLPPGTPLGIYGVRVVTAHGSSNIRLVMVDDLPTVYESNNKSMATAQVVKPPVAIEGTAEAESFDYFKFHADAGQRLSIEAVARRLGSGLDPVLRLFNSDGRELAVVDDDESAGADARLTYTFKKAGDYVVQLGDNRYVGSATYRYRLRLGDFPLLVAPYPLGAQAGTKAVLQGVGAGVDKLDPIKLDVPKDTVGGQLVVAAKYAAGQGSGLATLAVAAGSEQVEAEPNDAVEKATPITTAGGINGRFEKPKDRDLYRFTAKKGDKLRFTGQTRKLGSPTDLYLKILSADGKTTHAENDDLGLEESAVEYTVAADGTYLLAAEDLLRRGGPQYVYRIECGKAAPGFALALDVEKLDIPAGGVGKAKVTPTRLGYAGPLKFRVEGPDAAKFTVTSGAPIAKGEIPLTITVPESLKPGTHLSIRIIGEAAPEKGKENTAEGVAPTTAQLSPALSKLLGGMTNPPAALAEQVSVFIGDPIGELLKLTAAAKSVTLTGPTAKATLAIKLEKLNKFDDAVTLTVEGLPAGVTAAPVTVAKGKAEGVIEFVGSDKAKAAAAQPIKVIAAATFMDQPKKTTLGDLTLAIDAGKAEPKKDEAKPAEAKKVAAAEPAKPAVAAKTEPAKKEVAKAEPAKKEPAKKDEVKKEEAKKVEPKK